MHVYSWMINPLPCLFSCNTKMLMVRITFVYTFALHSVSGIMWYEPKQLLIKNKYNYNCMNKEGVTNSVKSLCEWSSIFMHLLEINMFDFICWVWMCAYTVYASVPWCFRVFAYVRVYVWFVEMWEFKMRGWLKSCATCLETCTNVLALFSWLCVHTVRSCI